MTELTIAFDPCRFHGALKAINVESVLPAVKFLKTVIGSLPPKHVPIEDAIKWAVDLQLKHGIDIISDGEQRADMIGYFNSFPGLGKKPHGLYIQSRILPMEDPKSFVKLNDLQYVKDYLERIGREDVKVKVTITGPITLGFSCAVNGVEYYSGLKDLRLYSDFAFALNILIGEIAKTGCYIQIDEPSLSTRVLNANIAVKIVNKALEGLPQSIREEEMLSLHTCGALSKDLFKDFMTLDISTISLAFCGHETNRNLDILSKAMLKDAGKKLGVGCVSVQAIKKEDVESHETIVSRLNILLEKVDLENIACFHPDCGLRNMNEELADLILGRMASSLQLWASQIKH